MHYMHFISICNKLFFILYIHFAINSVSCIDSDPLKMASFSSFNYIIFKTIISD